MEGGCREEHHYPGVGEFIGITMTLENKIGAREKGEDFRLEEHSSSLLNIGAIKRNSIRPRMHKRAKCSQPSWGKARPHREH